MSQLTTTRKCPFKHTLITKDFGCVCALEVTYRDGPGISCTNEQAHHQCINLFESLKVAALPAFDVTDDLTEMPASTLSKIQYGGLTALSEVYGEKKDHVDNIHTLVDTVYENNDHLDNIDYAKIVPTIKDFKLRRRRKR